MIWTEEQISAFCLLPVLIKKNVIPNLLQNWPDKLRKQYKISPPWNTQGPIFFKLFHLLTFGLLSGCSPNFLFFIDWNQYYRDLLLQFFPGTPNIYPIIENHINTLYSFLYPIWCQLQTSALLDKSWTIQDSEYKIKYSTDIFYGQTIVMIESGFHLTKHREKILMSLLLQATLLRQDNKTINYIGVLQPMQCTLHFWDITQWSEQSLWQFIRHSIRGQHVIQFNNSVNISSGIIDINSSSSSSSAASNSVASSSASNSVASSSASNSAASNSISLNNKVTDDYWQIISQAECWNNIGNILGVGYNTISSAEDTIRNIIAYRDLSTKPVQILLENINNSQVRKIYNNYFSHYGSVFIHGSLDINLVRNTSVGRCLSEINNALSVSAKGIVFHVGKSSKESDIELMIKNLDNILNSMTSNQCPLLLETPAGQGTELASTVEKFFQVLDILLIHINCGKLKICLDSCHVSAAGYSPVNYAQLLASRYGSNIIGLIHFNDSKTEFGSRIDRHFLPGYGYIGFKELYKLAELCHYYSWPAVVEVKLLR